MCQEYLLSTSSQFQNNRVQTFHCTTPLSAHESSNNLWATRLRLHRPTVLFLQQWPTLSPLFTSRTHRVAPSYNTLPSFRHSPHVRCASSAHGPRPVHCLIPDIFIPGPSQPQTLRVSVPPSSGVAKLLRCDLTGATLEPRSINCSITYLDLRLTRHHVFKSLEKYLCGDDCNHKFLQHDPRTHSPIPWQL